MKKTVFIIISLLVFASQAYAQDSYYFQYNLSIEYTSSCANQSQDGETVNVSVLNQSNSLIAEFDIDLNEFGLTYNNGNEVYYYPTSNSPPTLVTLNQRPYRIVANYTAYCEDTGGTANAYNYDLVFNHGSFHDYDVQDTNTGIGITTSIDASTGPVLSTPQTDAICVDELIFTDTEASEFVNGLTWEFLNASNQWVELYNYSDYYPLKYSVEDIIGSDYFSITGTNAIKLRYKYQFNSSSYEIESNIVIVDVGVCSPEITGFSSQNTTCSNSSDGSFTITFDRELDPGEVLTTVTLYHDGPDTTLNNGNDVIVTTLTDQTYTGLTYTWPNPLPADQYRLEYQSGGSNSLEEYFPILINSPAPVSFTATWTDVDCFGDNTGSISIVASGGQGNYEYSINNGANWFPFLSLTSHTVTNLVAGNYQVKVKDSNNCIAQQ